MTVSVGTVIPSGVKLGDIFWDLPPFIYYTPGHSIGCILYVANHTEDDKEYTILGYLYQGGFKLEEVPLQVHRFAWFPVKPGIFTRLHGNIVLDKTNVDLVVNLIEKETEEVTDSVSTRLVMPTGGILPPSWPVDGRGTGIDTGMGTGIGTGIGTGAGIGAMGLGFDLVPLLTLFMLIFVMDMVEELSEDKKKV